MSSDEELLAAWQAGDTDAGQQLARRYFPLVRSYFRHKAPADYQELVAQAFMRLVEKHDQFRSGGNFRCFLLGIARMILLESFRAKRRDARFDPLVSSAHDLGGPGLSTLVSERQELVLLVDALRRLPLAKQELLEFYYWQELTAKEIGSLVDAPEPTVRTRIRRTLEELRREHRALERIARRERVSELDIADVERFLCDIRALD